MSTGTSTTTDDGADGFTAERHRAYTWEDPSRIAEAARTRDGLDFLRAMASGELPGASPAPAR